MKKILFKKGVVLSYLLIILLSCSSKHIMILPAELIHYNEKDYKYNLITTDNEKMQFEKYYIKNDTLVIIQPKQRFYVAKPIEIPFKQIKKIYIEKYPNKTRNSILFFGSMSVCFLIFLILGQAGNAISGMGA